MMEKALVKYSICILFLVIPGRLLSQNADGEKQPAAQGFVIEGKDTIYDGNYIGFDSSINFVRINCKYPRIAMEEGLQGTVYVEVVVDKSGKVIKAKVLKGIEGWGKAGEALNQEACNCLKKTSVGQRMIDGRPVFYRETIQVKFQYQR